MYFVRQESKIDFTSEPSYAYKKATFIIIFIIDNWCRT